MNHTTNHSGLKTMHDDRIEHARELLRRITVRLDEEAAMEKYHWGHVGSLGHLVEELRELGSYWVGDMTSEE